MTIKRIVPNIVSNKFDKSKLFYIDFLGMKLAMDMDWILTFVSDSNPTAQISIVKTDQIDVRESSITLSIEVEDIDLLYAKAKLYHYEIVYDITDEPWGVRRFWVKDPNAVTINLMMHTLMLVLFFFVHCLHNAPFDLFI
jgi:predicted enzyme related to lactoylglutathione lyase